ncbi:hypothetical protein GBA52_008098 [Prunus armeniaca]|nr:hypothetical protein GBA52_008098 [Prunus armeniaca]
MFHNVGLKRNLSGEQACNLGSPRKKHKSHNKANNPGLIQKTATEEGNYPKQRKIQEKLLQGKEAK